MTRAVTGHQDSTGGLLRERVRQAHSRTPMRPADSRSRSIRARRSHAATRPVRCRSASELADVPSPWFRRARISGSEALYAIRLGSRSAAARWQLVSGTRHADAVTSREAARIQDGSFLFRNVPPGSYYLEAIREPGGRKQSGELPFASTTVIGERRGLERIWCSPSRPVLRGARNRAFSSGPEARVSSDQATQGSV